MRLIYVLPPVLAVLLGVEVLFNEGKADGILTGDNGAPKEFAQAEAMPQAAPSKDPILKSKNPWGADAEPDGQPEGYAKADDEAEDRSEERTIESGGDDGDTRIVAAPIVNAPPLAKPKLETSGPAVSAPRPELLER